MKISANIILFALFLSAPLYAIDSDIEVRPANEDFIESMPNQNVTTVLHVTNRSGELLEFVSDVELPEGWKLITREFPFELDDQQTEMKLLSFYVPHAAPAGQYQVAYRIRSRKYPSISGMTILQIQVQTHREYRLSILNPPEMAIAGDSVSFKILAENLSNVHDSLRIECTKSGTHRVVLHPAQISLAPKASRSIDVVIHTDRELSYDSNQFIQYRLFIQGQDKPAATVQSSIRILSRVQGPEDAYNRFPVDVAAACVGQKVDGKASSGFQGEMEGKGYLDEERKHHLYFHMRGPDAYQKALSIYAERDEYVAQYENDLLKVAAGDRQYGLSLLTQNSSYGRGGEIGLKLSQHVVIGAYVQKSRWFYFQHESQAAYLKFLAIPNSSLQFNFIHIDRKDRSGRIMSLSGRSMWKNVQLDAEWAVDGVIDHFNQSFELGLSGSKKFANYFLRWIYADPNFPGYYRDTNYLSSSFSLRPSKRIGFKFHFRSEKQNFELDTTRFSAPLTKYLQTGLDYYLFPNVKLSLDYIGQSRKDRLKNLFDYSEQSIRFLLSNTFGLFTFDASAEGGLTNNKIYNIESEMTKYTASLYFRPNAKQSYRGYFYWNNSIRYSGDKHRLLTAGLQLKYSLSDQFHAQLNLQNNFSPEEYYYDRNQSELLLKWILPNHHRVQLRGRRTYLKNSLNRTDMAYVAEYKAPLGIPISRKPNTCVVTGRVIDAQTLQPLEDLIIRINGSTAVSNDQGKFVFKNLRKKTYYLTIDKSTMGLNRVTVEKSPIEITTMEGKKGIDVQIGVVDGAVLSGRVLLQSTPSQRGTDEEGLIVGSGSSIISDTVSCEEGDYGLESVLVEMRRGDETLRRLTDKNGQFEFEELRPGQWTVKFYKRNLPEYHRYEKDLFTIQIEPGSKQILNACVVPQKRRIRFLQQGDSVIREQRR